MTPNDLYLANRIAGAFLNGLLIKAVIFAAVYWLIWGRK